MANSHKAILIAETKLHVPGVDAFKKYFGIEDWATDAQTDGEALVEIMGRLCYKSFDVKLNPNLTRIREGNRQYLDNVLSQGHGSVFEHSTVTFALLNVSRIFTHELVRHRVGVAYSQESQRFVRLDDFQVYIPDLSPALADLYWIRPDVDAINALKHAEDEDRWVAAQQLAFLDAVNNVRAAAIENVKQLIQTWDLDNKKVSFHVKKQITSALRRMIPGGVNTHIGVTANHRTWRHLINMRTSPGAEVEIVEVFDDIAEQLAARYPNIYQDMEMSIHQNGKHYSFPNKL